MSKVEVFEPALCCATGVCGEDVDQQFVTVSHQLSQLRKAGMVESQLRDYARCSIPTAAAELPA